MSGNGKKASRFDSDEFCRGFIDFYNSIEFEKYMKPYLLELIELSRDALEHTEDAKPLQERIRTARHILLKGESLVNERKLLASSHKDS